LELNIEHVDNLLFMIFLVVRIERGTKWISGSLSSNTSTEFTVEKWSCGGGSQQESWSSLDTLLLRSQNENTYALELV
jgi:hypothetical protein